MEELNLPPRLIAAGERTFGKKVNIYEKMSMIQDIKEALNASENDFILRSPLGPLLDIPKKPAWSGALGLFLLSRQLEITKEKEIWILFAGAPIRFSLREFKIVTGLACGKYPKIVKEKKKKKKKKQLLLGVEESVTLDGIISLLKSTCEEERDKRLRFACLALVEGILRITTKQKSIEHVSRWLKIE